MTNHTPKTEQRTAGFTPEQWVVDGETIYALNEFGWNIFSAKLQRYGSDGRKATSEEIAANAKLMGAAPRLLAALKGTIDGKVMEGHRDAIHPSGRFCTVCGVNSAQFVHGTKCPVGIAEAAIVLAEGRSL